MQIFEEDHLVEQSHERGLLLEKTLHEKLGQHPNVGDVRCVAILVQPRAALIVPDLSEGVVSSGASS